MPMFKNPFTLSLSKGAVLLSALFIRLYCPEGDPETLQLAEGDFTPALFEEPEDARRRQIVAHFPMPSIEKLTCKVELLSPIQIPSKSLTHRVLPAQPDKPSCLSRSP